MWGNTIEKPTLELEPFIVKCLKTPKEKSQNYDIIGVDLEAFSNQAQENLGYTMTYNVYQFDRLRITGFLKISSRQTIITDKEVGVSSTISSIIKHDEILNKLNLLSGRDLLRRLSYEVTKRNFVTWVNFIRSLQTMLPISNGQNKWRKIDLPYPYDSHKMFDKIVTENDLEIDENISFILCVKNCSLTGYEMYEAILNKFKENKIDRKNNFFDEINKNEQNILDYEDLEDCIKYTIKIIDKNQRRERIRRSKGTILTGIFRIYYLKKMGHLSFINYEENKIFLGYDDISPGYIILDFEILKIGSKRVFGFLKYQSEKDNVSEYEEKLNNLKGRNNYLRNNKENNYSDYEMKYIYLTVTKSENTEENQMIDEDDKEIYNKGNWNWKKDENKENREENKTPESTENEIKIIEEIIVRNTLKNQKTDNKIGTDDKYSMSEIINNSTKSIVDKEKYKTDNKVIEAINNLTSFIANKEKHKNNKGKDPEKDNDDNNKDISEIDNIEPDKIDKKNNDITKEEKNDKNLKKK
ncbi:hypothetical protein U3516DRAFT_782705 [Neocallimastix sp. 'constans']